MSNSPFSHPALTQPQREAIFDLLLLSTYADQSLRLKEETVLHEIISGLGWQSYQDPTEYADTATARVRTASENDGRTGEFLAALGERLGSDEAKNFALALLPRVLESDAAIADAEIDFATRARRAFGLA